MVARSSRRILLLGRPDVGTLDVVRDLTGSAPSPDPESGSTAGLTHEWHAKTAYYETLVPIWIDELADVPAWEAEFARPEAEEVVEAIGAWIYVFRKGGENGRGAITAEVETAMRSVQEVVETHAGEAISSAVMLAAALPEGGVQSRVVTPASAALGTTYSVRDQEEQEDQCLRYGFEYIDYEASGTNQFGEKVGFERLKEALESNEWTEDGAGNDEDDDDSWMGRLGGDDGWSGTDREEAEWTAEFFGVKAVLHGGGDDDDDDDAADERHNDATSLPDQQAGQVDELDRLMGRLLAVREQSAGLPEAERKRLAAQAVRDVMKQI